MLYKSNQRRSLVVCKALEQGLTRCGDSLTSKEKVADALIIYGMGPSHKEAFDRFRARNKPVIVIDLGYWDRGLTLGIHTSYKVSLNYWHPQKYVMGLNVPSRRFKNTGLKIQPWKKDGKHILVAGTGPKSYVLYDLPEMSFDLWIVKQLKKYTDMPIVYRPKPSWKNAAPIKGTRYSRKDDALSKVLNDSWAVVSHHSNVCVDGLLKGIPCFTWDGVATHMGLDDLSRIETPYYPENRDRFFRNLSYANWSIANMTSGECWRFFKNTFMS